MALTLLPFEGQGNILTRWWRNAVRPLASPLSLWSEVYRGDSVLAPLGFAYLWCLDGDARGYLRKTLRVFGYGWAWILPIDCILVTCSLYLAFNPLAALDVSEMLPRPNHAVTALWIAQLGVGLSTLGFLAWGLASLHRISLWKTLLASSIALVGLGFVGQVVTLSANRGLVWALLRKHETRQAEANEPKARIQRVIQMVEKIQEGAQGSFQKVGLPAPPRAVDLLTGGDWGAAMDLKQASERGFAPSCQVIYEQTLGALKGQVIHFSACLGERNTLYLAPEPAPLLPPGSESRAQQVNRTLKPDQRWALLRARSAFGDVIRAMESEIGPFEAPRQVAPRHADAAESAPRPSADLAPPPAHRSQRPQ